MVNEKQRNIYNLMNRQFYNSKGYWDSKVNSITGYRPSKYLYSSKLIVTNAQSISRVLKIKN